MFTVGPTTVGTLIGVILGGLITWWASRRYYLRGSEDLKKAANDLKAETGKVHQLVNVLGRALYNAGSIPEAQFDRDGNLTHLAISGAGSMNIGATMTGNGEVIHAEP